MAGLRGDLYDRMLRELSAQARLADDLGYDSISFTEHHFHVEGFELSNNPVLLDLFIGMQTRRIRVGQLGIVLPAQNPIRVAEDIAMLDHMTGGRANAGFARGYQRRWVDVMAQQLHGIHGALPHEHDAIDEANRDGIRGVASASSRRRGPKISSPTRDATGGCHRAPTPWDIDYTSRFGAGVQDGIVRAVGVVPKPLQRPHPPIFQPFASSERSIRWCAEEGVTAILPPLHPVLEARLVQHLRRRLGSRARRRHRRAARRRGGGHRRRGDGALERQRRVLRRGVVRAVRLLARPGAPGHRRDARPLRREPGAGGLGRYRHPAARAAGGTAPGAVALRVDLQRASSPTIGSCDRSSCSRRECCPARSATASVPAHRAGTDRRAPP